MLTALALLAMSTSGCATAVSSACPQEVAYSRQQQEAAADELDQFRKLNGDVGIIACHYMPDYGRLRDQARACRGVPVKS